MKPGTLHDSYKCKDCGLQGHKLWRDYGYCDELWCAACCEKRIAKAQKKNKPNPWLHEKRGPLNMMTTGFSGVAAIPCDEDFDSFQSGGAFKTPGLIWWHSLPTYADEDKEIITMREVMDDVWDRLQIEHKVAVEQNTELIPLRFLQRRPTAGPEIEKPKYRGYYHGKIDDLRESYVDLHRQLFKIQEQRMELYEEKYELEWRKNRRVYEIVKPTKITIWGSKTEKIDGEDGRVWYFTSGEEQERELKVGERIAVSNGRALLLDGDSTLKTSWTIMDHEQDGVKLVSRLYEEAACVWVSEERMLTLPRAGRFEHKREDHF